jgi:hypothetical protein
MVPLCFFLQRELVEGKGGGMEKEKGKRGIRKQRHHSMIGMLLNVVYCTMERWECIRPGRGVE